MMKTNKVLMALLSCVVASASAQDQAPVYELGSASSPVSTGSVSEQLQRLENKVDAGNRSRIKLQRQLDDLQTEFDELRGVTEQHSHQLNQILQRQRELYQEIDKRVSQALQPASLVPSTIASPDGEPVSYSNNLTENEAYDNAVNLVLKEKKYEEAIPKFQEFNQNFPNSTYAANSRYWLGQLLFNKGETKAAQAEFQLVVDNYPDSNKRPDAMLKLGMAAQKLGNNAKALGLYEKIISEYPDSTAAQLAQPRLDSLR